jgi:flagellar FliL protein
MSTEEEKEKPKSKMLIIIIVAVVVLLGAGGGAFMLMKKPAKVETATTEAKPISYSLPTFIVNLADPGSKRFLKVTMDLELDSPAASEECKTMDAQLRDAVLTVLSSQESGDIVTGDDKIRLKKLLVKALNRNLAKGKVLRIYFTDFLIQ